MRRRDALRLIGATIPAVVIGSQRAFAEDNFKLAIGQRGNWENSVCELGQNAGFFKKHGVTLEILYTEGGGQTQQAVISGSADIGIGVGTYGVLGAFAKNAPIRIIGASMAGAHDLYWYAKADSQIQTIKDAAGKTVAYSTTGSSTHLVVLGLAKTLGVQFQAVATGSPPSTFTQVMSGQISVGWSSPPFAVEAVDRGQIRIVARGSDVPAFAGQTVRVMIANAASYQRRSEAYGRFMQAYRETLDWLYADPQALDAYAAWAGVTPALAKRVRDEFFPKKNLEPGRIIGLPELMEDAVTHKYLPAPLSPDRIKTLVVLGTT
ncbi:NitT/TauT family transport system substrate-binding protein [Bosea sp. AK1]|uniref:ABC transporter substrate-binding protein n=1 Tax=Bosea sp. AK1 TaxID=2587160 RepID=UPI001152890F|nr:ABC transporter substrate-binding protein [Bosea sp. AK1]TQI65343.1 NitT/TauT family transport system substrate-binding protein [Bosea sp. AK1]